MNMCHWPLYRDDRTSITVGHHHSAPHVFFLGYSPPRCCGSSPLPSKSKEIVFETHTDDPASPQRFFFFFNTGRKDESLNSHWSYNQVRGKQQPAGFSHQLRLTVLCPMRICVLCHWMQIIQQYCVHNLSALLPRDLSHTV